MDKVKAIELRKKIIQGLKQSAHELIESKKKNNGKIVVSKDGQIKTINAVDLPS